MTAPTVADDEEGRTWSSKAWASAIWKGVALFAIAKILILTPPPIEKMRIAALPTEGHQIADPRFNTVTLDGAPQPLYRRASLGRNGWVEVWTPMRDPRSGAVVVVPIRHHGMVRVDADQDAADDYADEAHIQRLDAERNRFSGRVLDREPRARRRMRA